MELNKIYNENCLDTMAKMPDNYIDLTVTSPPYNMRLRVRNGEYTTREKSEHFSKKYDFFSDDLPIIEYFVFHSNCLKELLRVSKTILWNIQIVTGNKEAVFKIIGDYCLHIKDVIIWDKGHGQPAMHENCINKATEMILILESEASAGRTLKRAYFDRGTFTDIIRINSERNNIHGATFPTKLAKKLINSFSKEGDLVYDPFMGSGTTAKAAHLLKRNMLGS